jgi:DNA-binding MarR family transcriptional regulator
MNAPHSTHHDDDVAALRAFNRAYTRRLGLLNAHYDRSPFSLSEARVLYELAHRSDPTSADIMRALDLDRAQLSRTLKRFADRGLVEMRPGAGDARHRLLALTPAGQAAYAELEQNTKGRGRGAARNPARSGKRGSSLAATETIETGLRAPAGDLLRDPRPGDLGWIIHRQSALYARNTAGPATTRPWSRSILADFVETFDPAREAAWIAEADGKVVGSIFLVRMATRRASASCDCSMSSPRCARTGVGKLLVARPASRARAPSGAETRSCGPTAC